MTDPLKSLDDALKETFALEEEGATQLPPFERLGRCPQYMARPLTLTLDPFQMNVDRLILDTGLGTLALVQHIAQDIPPKTRLTEKQKKQLKTELERVVNQTAYLCHRLASDRLDRHEDNSDQPAGIPVDVELVLVHPEHAQTPTISQILTELHRDNSYLSAIGINVLPYKKDEQGGIQYDEKKLARAFCWLLDKVHCWLGRIDTPTERDTPPLKNLTLTNYRGTPKRKFLFEIEDEKGNVKENVRIHTLHGPNGSGKSSLVEALELMMTGTNERIEDEYATRHPTEKDYRAIIRYQDAPKDAEVQITWNADKQSEGETFTLTENGVEHPLGGKKPGERFAPSFRLNHVVMAQLTDDGDEQRAKLFIEAFFPEEGEKVAQFVSAKTEAIKTFRSPPKDVFEIPLATEKEAEETAFERRHDPFYKRFQWLDAEETVTMDQLNDALPLPMATLNELGAMDQLLQVVKAWQSEQPTPKSMAEGMATLSAVLQSLHGGAEKHSATLANAQKKLSEMNAWTSQNAPTTAAFPDLLNQWLEVMSLADMGEKEEQALAAFQSAEKNGWPPKDTPDLKKALALLPAFNTPERAKARAKLQKQVMEWQEEGGKYLNQLRRYKETTTDAHPVHLSPTDIEHLNRAGRWLGYQERNLGEVLKKMLDTNNSTTFDNMTLGVKTGWADDLLARLKNLSNAYTQLTALESKDLDRHAWIRTARKALADMYEKKRAMVNLVLTKFSPDTGEKPDEILANAINQLMALLTPARWNYEDLQLAYDAKNKRLTLTTQDGEKGALRVNTSALNTFALALFLLCAPRVENPLRLLVLDDPLQNMDEHTVTSLARGIARLLAIYPEGWQLMFLFHGEDNMERFRRVVPSAVYRLPWIGTDEKDPIKYDQDMSMLGNEYQSLESLIKLKAR